MKHGGARVIVQNWCQFFNFPQVVLRLFQRPERRSLQAVNKMITKAGGIRVLILRLSNPNVAAFYYCSLSKLLNEDSGNKTTGD